MCSKEHLEIVAGLARDGRFSELPNPLVVAEAEVIARRSRTTITRACISGKLKAVQTGNKWNINRDSLLAYAGLI